MGPATAVDWDALRAALDTRRTTRSMRWRDIADESGVPPPTLSRLNTGHRIDISGYAGCCRWLDVPLDTFITPRTSQHQPPARGDLSAELLALFQDHGIPEVHRRALHDLVTQLAPAPEDPA